MAASLIHWDSIRKAYFVIMPLIDQITVPTLIVDENICRRNIQKMCDRAKRLNVELRPHFKTHQSTDIGHWFRDAGIRSITTSSLRMAEYFAEDGWEDITVAFPINILETDLINRLASRVRLTVLVQDPQVIRELDSMLATTVHAHIKVDVGTGRTGIPSSDHAHFIESIDAIDAATNISWAGFLAHAGHTYRARGIASVEKTHQEATAKLADLRDEFFGDREDLIVSYGDTPSCSVAESSWDGIDEIRPGNFVYYDLMQVQIGCCALEDIGVAMYCPVVAVHPERSACLVYGGGIHFSKDRIELDGVGVVFGQSVTPKVDGWQIDSDPAYLIKVSQEHGVVQLPDHMNGKVKPGDIIGLLPIHSCMSAQSMGAYMTTRGEVLDHFARQVRDDIKSIQDVQQ